MNKKKYTCKPRASGVLMAAAALSMMAGMSRAEAQTAPAPAGVAPQAVHIVCLAEKQETLLGNLSLLKDFEGLLTGANALVKTLNGKGESSEWSESVLTDLRSKMRAAVFPIDDFYAKSIGSGVVVDAGRRFVLTTFHVGSSCPFSDGSDGRGKQQLAILDPTGGAIKPIRGDAVLAIQKRDENGNVQLNANGQPVVVDLHPKFICSNTNDVCAKANSDLRQALDAQRDVFARKSYGNASGEARKKLAAEDFDRWQKDFRADVKHWAPDLMLIELREAASIPQATFAVDPDPKKLALRLSGFPLLAQQGREGTAHSAKRILLTEPVTQTATFSGIFKASNDAGKLVSTAKVVEISLLELTGVQALDGNGGAPLYDAKSGLVVGVMDKSSGSGGASSSISYAIPAANVINFLRGIREVKFAAKPIEEIVAPPKPVTPEPQPLAPETRWPLIGGLLAAFVAMAGAIWWFQRKKPEAPRNEVPTAADHQTKPVYVWKLRGAQGPLAGREFLIPTVNGNDTVQVGKNPHACQIVFPDATTEVSTVHCRFIFDSKTKQFFVEDVRSTNGTFVNKRKLNAGEKVRLSGGDVVSLARPDTNMFSVSEGV